MYIHVHVHTRICTNVCMQKAAEKKKNWRRKHEDFINSIRSAREYTEAEATGTHAQDILAMHVHVHVHVCTCRLMSFGESTLYRI